MIDIGDVQLWALDLLQLLVVAECRPLVIILPANNMSCCLTYKDCLTWNANTKQSLLSRFVAALLVALLSVPGWGALPLSVLTRGIELLICIEGESRTVSDIKLLTSVLVNTLKLMIIWSG